MIIDFAKYTDGLVPAIIQDEITGKVLMLGFMNDEALSKTQELKKVTFYSRSKNRLWTKGEESGNFLMLKSITVDCDNDTLLIKVNPVGPVCHTGADTCLTKKMKPMTSYSNWKKLLLIEKIIQLKHLTPLPYLKKVSIK